MNFTHLPSSVLCLRGARSMRRRPAAEASVGIIVDEGMLLS